MFHQQRKRLIAEPTLLDKIFYRAVFKGNEHDINHDAGFVSSS